MDGTRGQVPCPISIKSGKHEKDIYLCSIIILCGAIFLFEESDIAGLGVCFLTQVAIRHRLFYRIGIGHGMGSCWIYLFGYFLNLWHEKGNVRLIFSYFKHMQGMSKVRKCLCIVLFQLKVVADLIMKLT